MKVNGMATALNNEYIFKMYFWLTNYSSHQTLEDAHEYLIRLRECLLEELQPSLDISNVTKDGLMYDEHLHSSMQSYWDLFSTRVYMQKITCTICNKTSKKEEPFSELMLHFPPLHHESNLPCTLNELIIYHNAPEEIHDYQWDTCNMRTCARKKRVIIHYPKIMCIVLSRSISNETKIKSAVQYPLHGFFGSVHHKLNRNKSGHYIAICEHRASNDWFSYDDDIVKRVKFMNKNN
jgi:ubiquitin C-terminal hydrolase